MTTTLEPIVSPSEVVARPGHRAADPRRRIRHAYGGAAPTTRRGSDPRCSCCSSPPGCSTSGGSVARVGATRSTPRPSKPAPRAGRRSSTGRATRRTSSPSTRPRRACGRPSSSARIFGVNSWSILAPQALEGVAAVGVLYLTVRRWFGPAAGLIAGAVFAFTPVATLMFRFNNPDALLVLCLVLAAYWLTPRDRRRQHQVGRAHRARTRVRVPGQGAPSISRDSGFRVRLPPRGAGFVLAAHPPRCGDGRLDGRRCGLVDRDRRPHSRRRTVRTSADRPTTRSGTCCSGTTASDVSRATKPGVWARGPGGPGTTGRWGATGWTRMFNSQFGGEASWLLPAALAPARDRTRGHHPSGPHRPHTRRADHLGQLAPRDRYRVQPRQGNHPRVLRGGVGSRDRRAGRHRHDHAVEATRRVVVAHRDGRHPRTDRVVVAPTAWTAHRTGTRISPPCSWSAESPWPSGSSSSRSAGGRWRSIALGRDRRRARRTRRGQRHHGPRGPQRPAPDLGARHRRRRTRIRTGRVGGRSDPAPAVASSPGSPTDRRHGRGSDATARIRRRRERRVLPAPRLRRPGGPGSRHRRDRSARTSPVAGVDAGGGGSSDPPPPARPSPHCWRRPAPVATGGRRPRSAPPTVPDSSSRADSPSWRSAASTDRTRRRRWPQFQQFVKDGKVHYFISSNFGVPGGGQSGTGTTISAWVQANYTARTVSGVTIYDLSAPKAG